MHKAIAITIVTAAIGLGILQGCSKTEEPTAQQPAADNKLQTAPSATPAAFKNDKGQLVCPVTGAAIASEKEAVGHEDYKDKRYFFCCGMCPPEFKKNPEKYAEGKAIKSGQTLKM